MQRRQISRLSVLFDRQPQRPLAAEETGKSRGRATARKKLRDDIDLISQFSILDNSIALDAMKNNNNLITIFVMWS